VQLCCHTASCVQRLKVAEGSVGGSAVHLGCGGGCAGARGRRRRARRSSPTARTGSCQYRRGVPLPGWMDVDPHEEPLQVLEEMEMEEEYLQWASYVFPTDPRQWPSA